MPQFRGAVLLQEKAADPATPASGWGELYPKADGKLYWKDDAGVVYDLTATGSSGGAQFYTALNKTADQAIQSATAGAFSDITDLAFAMAANTAYEIEGRIYWTVAATTTGFRWGIAGPGVATGAVHAEYFSAVTTKAFVTQNHNASALTPSMAATAASLSPAPIPNMLEFAGRITNGATAGNLRVQFASELANTPVTVLRGSNLRWRAV